MNLWVAVFLGGGTGSMVRFAISRLVLALGSKAIFPWATLISNTLACALLAWLVLRFGSQEQGREHWHALLAIGFCGGFSTLSTFSFENYQLMRDGFFAVAIANIVISIALGLVVFHFFARPA